MNFTLKIIKNDKTIQRVRTHSARRFGNSLRTINWKNCPLKVYLKVNYGKHEDCFGKMTTFYNDGWYDNKEDLWWAFDVFSKEKF